MLKKTAKTYATMPKDPKYSITAKRREQVAVLLAADTPMWKIERIMKINENVLRRHYPEVFASYPRAGQKPFDPSPETLRQIEVMAGLGIKTNQIALVLGIPKSTLYRCCKDLIDTAATKMNTQVGYNLFKMATGDITHKNTAAAAIWWSKARMQWEDPSRMEQSAASGGQIINQVQIVLPDNGRADAEYSGPLIEHDRDDRGDEEGEGTSASGHNEHSEDPDC